MKKLFKTSLTSLIIALVASLTVSVYAYSGTMDANDNIKINNSISNGTGTVQITQDVANGYKLYYQWVETDANSFKEIQKINEEIEIISYYNIYQSYAAQGINNTEYGQKYEDAQRAYQAKYGSTLGSEAFTTSYYAELKARKINLLPNYDDTKWTETTDNTFKMDLSTFSGTKDYTAWLKLVTTSGTTAYDAEIFQLTGTKQASTGDNTNTGNNNNNNNNNSGNTNTDNNNNNNSGNTNTDNNNNNNSGNTNTDNNNNSNNGNTNTDNNNNNNSGNTNTDNNNNNNSGNTNTDNNNNSNNGNTNTDNNNNNNSGNTNTDNNNNNNSGNTDKNNSTSNKDDGKDTPTTTTKNDQTTSNTKLPQTGVSYGVVIAMLAVAGYGIAQFVKYKRIK